jgi:DNA-binding PadR family transcriptional regulator
MKEFFRAPSLSAKEATILGLLVEFGHLYGLELVAKSDGQLKRGTVYVTLGRMEEKGFIRSMRGVAPASGGLPRPRYSITAEGRNLLAAYERAGLFALGKGALS